jgi:osmotically-inducible protein OsmY
MENKRVRYLHGGRVTGTLVLTLSVLGITSCTTHENGYAGSYSSQVETSEGNQTLIQTAAKGSDSSITTASNRTNNSTHIYSTPDNNPGPTSSNTATRIYSEPQMPPASHLDHGLADQGTSEADRVLAHRIRQNIMNDSSLAVGASNIKILVNDGKATLEGSVKTREEKQNLEAFVQKTSGVASVDNQLEVKSSPP